MTARTNRRAGRRASRPGDSSATGVAGEVADGFGPVADAFTRNFDRNGEVGAAVAAFVDGRLVVDLYAGMADPAAGRDWTRDTTAVMYSCGKGIVALCVYQLVQEGRLDLNAPMARYWPEFGQSGKQDVTVRCVLARALAESAPLWPPGNAHT